MNPTITLSASCDQNGRGVLSFTARTTDSGEGIPLQLSVQLRDANGAYLTPFTGGTPLSREVYEVPNGTYTAEASDQDGESITSADVVVNCTIVANPGGGGNPTVPAGQLIASYCSRDLAGKRVRLYFDPATKAVGITFADDAACGLNDPAHPAADSVLYDACDGTTRDRVYYRETDDAEYVAEPNSTHCGYVTPDPDPDPDPNPNPQPVLGCTDSLATNYNAAATVDNGTCAYTPPVVVPLFRVPLLNPLRFVAQVAANSCTSFETLDNALFCQQTRLGQPMRPRYRQKVQLCDIHTIQVHTNAPAGFTADILRIVGTSEDFVRSVVATRKQRLTGLADPLTVVLSAAPGGLTWLQAPAGGALPVSLQRAARLTLTGGATGTYRVTDRAVLSTRPALLLNRPWAAAATAVTARWQLSAAGFDVWEADLAWLNETEGEYVVVLRAVDTEGDEVQVRSEPIWLQDRHENTVCIDYASSDNSFGMVWTTGLTGRVRVGGACFKRRPAGNSTLHRSSSGKATLLASTVQRQALLETMELPDWQHELLYVALRLDSVRVNGEAYLAPDGYAWSDSAVYPLSNGTATLELLAGLGVDGQHNNGSLPTSDADTYTNTYRSTY